MFRRFRKAVTTAVVAAVVLTGCGSDTYTDADTDSGRGAMGTVTVFAAASLTQGFTDLQTKLGTGNPHLTIIHSFGGSGALVSQVKSGSAPADVIATADMSSMKQLTDANLVQAPVTFAKNKLEILVKPDNPKHIRTLADLSNPDLKVVLGDSTVPAGKYAAQILSTAQVTVKPVSKETDAKAAVSKVTNNDADATIVYVTDVNDAGRRGQGVEIPDAQNVVAEYPIAVVKATENRLGAQAYVDYLRSSEGQQVLRKRGFLPAT